MPVGIFSADPLLMRRVRDWLGRILRLSWSQETWREGQRARRTFTLCSGYKRRGVIRCFSESLPRCSGLSPCIIASPTDLVPHQDPGFPLGSVPDVKHGEETIRVYTLPRYEEEVPLFGEPWPKDLWAYSSLFIIIPGWKLKTLHYSPDGSQVLVYV